jgi:hypothetical protein
LGLDVRINGCGARRAEGKRICGDIKKESDRRSEKKNVLRTGKWDTRREQEAIRKER